MTTVRILEGGIILSRDRKEDDKKQQAVRGVSRESPELTALSAMPYLEPVAAHGSCRELLHSLVCCCSPAANRQQDK